jgi:hypothetical protein
MGGCFRNRGWDPEPDRVVDFFRSKVLEISAVGAMLALLQ